MSYVCISTFVLHLLNVPVKVRSHVTSSFEFSRMEPMVTSGIVSTQLLRLLEVDRNLCLLMKRRRKS